MTYARAYIIFVAFFPSRCFDLLPPIPTGQKLVSADFRLTPYVNIFFLYFGLLPLIGR